MEVNILGTKFGLFRSQSSVSSLLLTKVNGGGYNLNTLLNTASGSGIRCCRAIVYALAVALFSLITFPVSATNPIIYDFENPADDSQWQLNVGNAAVVGQLENKWCFSTAEYFTGKRSLVISNKFNDAVPAASYSNTGSDVAVVAKVLLTLPRGTYDLSFAWKCVGERGSDGFYVLWESDSYTISSSMAGAKPDLARRAIHFPGQWHPLCVKSSWQTESVEIKSDGTQKQLAFVWINNGVNSHPVSACIDLVQISEKKDCTKPTDVHVASTLYAGRSSVTWKGVAEEYELMYRRLGDPSDPIVIEDITTRSYTVEIDEYGMYDFFVRGICGEDTSVWVPFRNHLIYSPGCIDYANLYSENVVCRHNVRPDDAEWDDGRGDQGFPSIDASPWIKGVVDNGPDSMSSRHTVHTIPEYDPRTNYKLSTIPNRPGDDDVVSVRLGNWNMGAEGESITYTITADSIYRIILLKYAVVFQDPNHDAVEQPFFSLKITNERGEPIKGICGKEDFRPSVNLGEDDGWHKEEYDLGSGTKDVVRWKEWTSVGVIIPEEEFGKKLHIELKTYDCEQGGHYGYAYFTLSCAPAAITGIACGEQKEQNISAPPGFTYEWYLDDPNDPNDQNNVLFNTQAITVDGKDARTYYCDCGFVTTNPDKQEECTFTLSANLTPRFPLASAILQKQPSKCEFNSVKFNNLSTVVSDEGVPLGGERCDSYEWEIIGVDADSVFIPIDENPVVTFPREGGTYKVRLKAGMSNGGCEDDTVITLNVPPLFPRETWIDTVVCNKYPFFWNGNKYTESSRDTVSYRMDGGCDSTIYLNLVMVEELADTIIDTICQGMSYEFYGQNYTTTGEYMFAIPADKKSDCDEIHYLLLTVIDSLSVDVSPLPEICADTSDFSLVFTVNQGEYTSVTLDFDTQSESVGFSDTTYSDVSLTELVIRLPEGIRPDWYAVDMKFATEHCDTLVRHVPFCVLYPVDVLSQKWNDVIAVLNSAYNGGYDFAAYRWYRGGVEMPGQTASYLYLDEGRVFDYASSETYSAGLMRRGESYYIRTCSCMPASRTDKSEYVRLNNVAAVGQRLELPAVDADGALTARWWSVSGQLISECGTSAQAPVVTAPHAPGIYLLELVSDGERQVVKVQVK